MTGAFGQSEASHFRGKFFKFQAVGHMMPKFGLGEASDCHNFKVQVAPAGIQIQAELRLRVSVLFKRVYL